MAERFFLVTSRGQTGTRWLARALNSHPEVVCSHGPGEPEVSLNYERPPTDDERRANIEGITQRRQQGMGVDEIFAELKAHGPGQAFGNVHLHTLRTLAAALERRPTQRPFRLVNLVRHPVSWLHSASHNQATILGLSEAARAQRLFAYHANRALFDELTRPHGVDPTETEALAFLGSCVGSLPGLAQELGTPGVVQVPMERMTTDRRYFAALTQGLVGDEIPVDEGWVEEVFSQGATNKHAAGSAEPLARFEGWPAWKRAALSRALSAPGMRQAFSRAGYDLSFVPQWGGAQHHPAAP